MKLPYRVMLFAVFLFMTGRALADETAPKAAAADTTPKPAEPKPEWKFAFHGFLGGSLFVQDAFLGPSPGQQPMWAVGKPKTDPYMLGGDIRQNRFNLSVAGPTVLGGAVPRGVVELDFFAGNGPGGFGDVSVLPRARVTFAELGWKNTTLRFGQDFNLVAGFSTLAGPATSGSLAFPTSVGHIAFPVTYGAGSIGWRYPGLTIFHRIPLGDNKLELALQIARAAWANPANPIVGTVNGTTAIIPFFNTNTDLGSATGVPQFEARATYAMGDILGVMVTGHWSEVDPSGWGVDPTGVCSTKNPAGCGTKQVEALSASFRLNVYPFVLQGGGYVGKNDSPLIGAIVQFPNLGAPDVSEIGGWAQAGFSLTKELSVLVLAGTEQPNYDEAKAAGMYNLSNTITQAELRYFVGGFATGLEWTHWHTRTAAPTAGIFIPQTSIDANQYMLSMYYFF